MQIDVRLIMLDKIMQNNSKAFSSFGYINCLARKKQLDIRIDAMAENMWIVDNELYENKGWIRTVRPSLNLFLILFNTEEKCLIMKFSAKNIHGNIISGNKELSNLSSTYLTPLSWSTVEIVGY